MYDSDQDFYDDYYHRQSGQYIGHDEQRHVMCPIHAGGRSNFRYCGNEESRLAVKERYAQSHDRKVSRSNSRRPDKVHNNHPGNISQNTMSFYFTNVPSDISYISLR